MQSDIDLLDLVNAERAKLGVRDSLIQLPALPEFSSLKGLNICMIDDSAGIIAHYIPFILPATGGSGLFIFQTSDVGIDNISEQLSEFNPDLILIDYFLAGGLRGDMLCSALSKTFPDVLRIGFSSVGDRSDIKHAFLQAGACASIRKGRDQIETLYEIEQVVLLET